MGNYSIRELEKLSGIKAHTIRMWEKRHRIIEPQRTPTNIRYYSDADLKKIINVSVLNSHGFKISRIARMTLSELNDRILELSTEKDEANLFIDQLVVAMVDLDEEKFDTVLNQLIKRFGFEATTTDIVYPFLEKIGLLWQTGNITPAQEHFISNLVRQKIMVATDGLDHPVKEAPKVVLFLPENELHEIGLLFYNYISRKNGFKTFYLGQHLPYADLKSICETHKPAFIITSLTTTAIADQVTAYLERLVRDFPSSRIMASGSLLPKIKTPGQHNFHRFRTAKELQAILFQS